MVEHACQHAAIHRARTAADISNRYGNGNLKYRSRKRPNGTVECEVTPAYVDNRTVSLPGLGHIRPAAEQPYQYQANWLYRARSFRLINVSPYDNMAVWRLYVTYDMVGAEPRTDGMAVGIDRGTTNPTVVARSGGSVACNDTASRFRTQRSNSGISLTGRISLSSKLSRFPSIKRNVLRILR